MRPPRNGDRKSFPELRNWVRRQGSLANWVPLVEPLARGEALDSGLPQSSNPASGSGEIQQEATVCEGSKTAPRPRNYAWADLMRRVFSTDVLVCECCGGPMRILSAIHPPETTQKILGCLGLPSRAPPVARAAANWEAEIEPS